MQLLHNGLDQRKVPGTDEEIDFFPVVRLFLPGTSAVWLLTELNADNLDIAFGLCDLGLGFPELGYVSLMKLMMVRGPGGGFGVARDPAFVADRPLSAYAWAARECGRIVTDLPPLTDDGKEDVADPCALSPYLAGEGLITLRRRRSPRRRSGHLLLFTQSPVSHCEAVFPLLLSASPLSLYCEGRYPAYCRGACFFCHMRFRCLGVR